MLFMRYAAPALINAADQPYHAQNKINPDHVHVDADELAEILNAVRISVAKDRAIR
jgi:hypothetical protein